MDLIEHYKKVQTACDCALKIIGITKLKFRPMRRQDDHVNTKRGFVIGRTNLKTGLITIDIFTPKFRKPKKISSILRTLAHEAAHHQKPPYRSRFRGRIITRIHYPIFYRQVTRNIKKLKKDKTLGEYFSLNRGYRHLFLKRYARITL
ncbi:MAG: hypothetical protein WCV70_01130 [Patescibacteria group bacterium]|jgi:hypothetical protein